MPVGIGGAGASLQFQDEFHMMAAPFYPTDPNNPEVYAPGYSTGKKDNTIEESPETLQDKKTYQGVDLNPLEISNVVRLPPKAANDNKSPKEFVKDFLSDLPKYTK